MAVSALWRRLDTPGHDIARLEETSIGPLLSGTAVFLADEGPAQLSYHVELARDWTTRSGLVRGFIGDAKIDLSIVRGADNWTVNGRPQPDLGPLVDLDFGFTPATNAQQLYRINLGIGEKADLPVAWLDTGASALVELPQCYRRIDEVSYAYEAPTVPYSAILLIADTGFVRSYPGLWELELVS